MEISLRDYQTQGYTELRWGFAKKFRTQLVNGPTGCGKMTMAAKLLLEARNRGTPTAFLVDRVALVRQASETLDRYDIDHGIVQAGHWRYRPNELIQVCSAQTIEKRGFFPNCKLLIVDECHCLRTAIVELIKNREDLKVVGFTATPFSKGLDIYENTVNLTTTRQLQREGWLVPLVAYAAKAIDMKGAKVVAGEWSEKDMHERGMDIVGDIPDSWLQKTHEHFGGPVKTIVFGPSTDYNMELAARFQALNYNFQVISYLDKDDDRRAHLLKAINDPASDVMGLIACEILTKGFDAPNVQCGVSVRPYRSSLANHIQQIGRVLRPKAGVAAPGEIALWLDHSGNYLRFYEDTEHFFEHGVQTLKGGQRLADGPRAEPEEKEVYERKCQGCGRVLEPRVRVCPECGFEKPRQLVEVKAGVMVRVGKNEVPAVGKYAYLSNPSEVWRQLCSVALARKQGDPILAQRWAQAKFMTLYGRWHSGTVTNTQPIEPCEQLMGYIKSQDIRGFHRRRAA